MRRMKKILKSVLLVLILGLFTGISESFAQPSYWNDSLRVSIADSMVDANGYLHFKIVVERTNEEWNNNDTILGESDFYFWANLDAFVGAPELVSVHPHLWGGAALGTDSARLQATTQVWAGRLQVALTDRGKDNKYKYKVALGLHQPDTICEVKWKLTPVYAVNLGITWDGGRDGSTGLQTLGGNPILESLEGSILKIPEPLIEVDCGEEEYAVCEGSDIVLGLHALSSGDSLKFVWYDSIPARGLAKISRTDTLRTLTTADGNVTYKYRFSAKGDSLYLYNVPGAIDSIYFFCTIKDTTIEYPAQYCTKQLFVRDSIWGFISPAADMLTYDKVDTVSACMGDDVAVRFNFYGVSQNEFADIDSVYFVYVLDSLNSGGYRIQDTAGFSVSQLTMGNVNFGAVGGQDVYWFPGTVSGYGKYYISSIYTRYCSSAAPNVHYDTLFVEPGNSQTLPRLTALVGQTITMDSLNSPIFSNGGVGPTVLPTAIQSKGGLGTITTASLGRLPFKYTAGSVSGLDTIVYTLPESDHCMIMREIEVQDMKYLALKVFLEGPYLAGSNTMRAFLTTANLTNPMFDDSELKNTVGSHYSSPYEKDSVECNQFRTMLTANESQGKYFTDFIYIRLRDGATGPIVASKTALLRTDGIVCDLEGHEYLGFKNLPGASYYVIVQHRNHLRVMSANPVPLPTNSSNAANLIISSGTDFSDIINVMDNWPALSNTAEKRMSNGKYVMYAGDVNQTDGTMNGINVGDISAITFKQIPPYSVVRGFYKEDLTFDGYVNSTDKQRASENRGIQQKFLP